MSQNLRPLLLGWGQLPTPYFLFQEQPGKQLQKDPLEDFSEIDANRHGEGADLVPGVATKPQPRLVIG